MRGEQSVTGLIAAMVRQTSQETAVPTNSGSRPRRNTKVRQPTSATRNPGRGALKQQVTDRNVVDEPKESRRPRSRGNRPAPGVTESAGKQERLVALLGQKDGATMTEMTQATGWQEHSVRGFISGTLRKKRGLTIECAVRSDGRRGYQIKP